MVNLKLITERLVKDNERNKIMHSSEYARAQNGGSFGAASTESFSARQEMEQRRKYVQGYKNSRIMNNYYGAQRAREMASYGGVGNARGAGSAGSIGNARGKVANPMDVAVKRAQFSAGQGMESRGPAIRPMRTR